MPSHLGPDLGGDGTDKKPADVVAVEWYMANKDNPEAMAAWEKVHTLKDKSLQSIQTTLIAANPMMKPAEARKIAEEIVGQMPIASFPSLE